MEASEQSGRVRYRCRRRAIGLGQSHPPLARVTEEAIEAVAQPWLTALLTSSDLAEALRLVVNQNNACVGRLHQRASQTNHELSRLLADLTEGRAARRDVEATFRMLRDQADQISLAIQRAQSLESERVVTTWATEIQELIGTGAVDQLRNACLSERATIYVRLGLRVFFDPTFQNVICTLANPNHLLAQRKSPKPRPDLGMA